VRKDHFNAYDNKYASKIDAYRLAYRAVLSLNFYFL